MFLDVAQRENRARKRRVRFESGVGVGYGSGHGGWGAAGRKPIKLRADVWGGPGAQCCLGGADLDSRRLILKSSIAYISTGGGSVESRRASMMKGSVLGDGKPSAHNPESHFLISDYTRSSCIRCT